MNCFDRENNSLENLYTFLVSVICTACFISLILLVLITLKILEHIHFGSSGNTSDVYSIGPVRISAFTSTCSTKYTASLQYEMYSLTSEKDKF